MDPAAEPAPLAIERTHLARNDLNWLPPSMKAVRWTVAGAIRTAIGGLTIGTIALSKFHLYFYGKGIAALAAGGYYAGDRAARAVLRRRLRKLARGAVDLTRLEREADGELIHVGARVRARATLSGLVDGAPAVYRRMVFAVPGGARVVHEAAVDFSIVDQTGEVVTVEAADARLLAPEPKRVKLDHAVMRQIANLPLPPKVRTAVFTWLQRLDAGERVAAWSGGEVLLKDGDAVELVGYKSRVVDQSVASRMERETPMRATLRSGRELPLLIAPQGG